MLEEMQRIREGTNVIADGLDKWKKKIGVVLGQAKLSGKKEVKALAAEIGRKRVEEWSGESAYSVY